MRVRLLFVLFTLVILTWYALAADAPAHAKLIGEWKADDPANEDGGTWILEAKGDVFKVTHSVGDRKVMEFACAATGEECATKDSGKSAKVSVWFNGPKLVEMETKGKEIVKRRFSVGQQDDDLQLEVIPMSPAGKAETLHLTRVRK